MEPTIDPRLPPHQRSARNDPDMRDGDSGHGNPGEPAGDRNAFDSDTDVGDTNGGPEVAAEENNERQETFEDLEKEYLGDQPASDAPPPGVTTVDDPKEQEQIFGHNSDDQETREVDPEAEPALPIPNYQQLNVATIIRHASGLNAEQAAKLLEYEKSHRNRKMVIARMNKIIAHTPPK